MSTIHVVHWDEIEKRTRAAGDIASTWTLLGAAAGTRGVGLNRIEVTEGNRTTALHVHGAEEEIFFVLAGSGLLYQGRSVCDVSAGDCIVHLPEKEPHTLRGGPQGLDVLAFGTRVPVEICYLPRAGMAWGGPTALAAPGILNLWEKDAASGPFADSTPGPRPTNVVAVESFPAQPAAGHGRSGSWRALGSAAGAVKAGLNLITLDPGSRGAPAHCHAAEEEIFVILRGQGVCTLDTAEIPVRRGHVVARPPGTGIAHSFQAGPSGMDYLAYGTRETNDIAYYPKSRKLFLRGIGLIGRIEPLDYWDGEE